MVRFWDETLGIRIIITEKRKKGYMFQQITSSDHSKSEKL